MSVQVDLYVAPAAGRALSGEVFLEVVDDLLREKLVVPPYRVFRGGKGLADAIRAPTTLIEYVPEWGERLPRGTKFLDAKDDRRALRTALEGCDLDKTTVVVDFAGLDWEAERVRVGGRMQVVCPAAVALASAVHEIVFAFDDEQTRTGEWRGRRVRRVDEARFRQCMILSGEDGPDVRRITGSVVEAFARKHLGADLQVVESYS
jgi:hypothetical protein